MLRIQCQHHVSRVWFNVLGAFGWRLTLHFLEEVVNTAPLLDKAVNGNGQPARIADLDVWGEDTLLEVLAGLDDVMVELHDSIHGDAIGPRDLCIHANEQIRNGL